MNALSEVVVDKEGNQVELNKWIEEENGKVMYTKPVPVPFCAAHKFSKNHECTKCPYIFTGFRGHLHIQKDDGIYDRKTGKKIA